MARQYFLVAVDSHSDGDADSLADARKSIMQTDLVEAFWQNPEVYPISSIDASNSFKDAIAKDYLRD